jgi:ABC-type Fe3+/spermidine/putrescine transport system ATPase subunit
MIHFTRRKEGGAVMTPVPLKLNNIQKQFGRAAMLRGVDFSLLSGEFLSLIGPAGCGKTVLSQIIAGLSRPSFGRILLDGVDVTDLKPFKRGICSVFRDTPLFPHRSVLSNVIYGLKLQGINRKERRGRAMHTLALADLEDVAERKPRQLSNYQYKMAVLVRALALRPHVLVLDDPFSGLAEGDRRRILAFLKALQQQWHFSVLYLTRDREEAMAVSHRMALLLSGRIEQAGTPEEIYHHPESVDAAQVMGLTNLLPGVVTARRPGGMIAIDTDGLTLPAQALGPPPTIGEDILLCLRPEQVRLFDSPRPDSLLSGVFTEYRQESGRRLIAVSLPTGREILCDDPQAGHFSPGTRVFLWWDTAKAALLTGEEQLQKADAAAGAGKEVPLCVP